MDWNLVNKFSISILKLFLVVWFYIFYFLVVDHEKRSKNHIDTIPIETRESKKRNSDLSSPSHSPSPKKSKKSKSSSSKSSSLKSVQSSNIFLYLPAFLIHVNQQDPYLPVFYPILLKYKSISPPLNYLYSSPIFVQIVPK